MPSVTAAIQMQPWLVTRINECQVATGVNPEGQMLLVLLLPDGTAIETPLSREAAEAIGKALLAPHLHMP